MASLFYNVGNFKKAERCYILYTKLIEANYGIDSMEVSNCYFMLSIFYIENNYLRKAMACISKCLKLRTNELGYDHLSLGDCYHNIGIIYLLAGRPESAIRWILNGQGLKNKNAAQENMTTAKMFEMLGMAFLEQDLTSSALNNFKKAREAIISLQNQSENPNLARLDAKISRIESRAKAERLRTPKVEDEEEVDEKGLSANYLGKMFKNIIEKPRGSKELSSNRIPERNISSSPNSIKILKKPPFISDNKTSALKSLFATSAGTRELKAFANVESLMPSGHNTEQELPNFGLNFRAPKKENVLEESESVVRRQDSRNSASLQPRTSIENLGKLPLFRKNTIKSGESNDNNQQSEDEISEDSSPIIKSSFFRPFSRQIIDEDDDENIQSPEKPRVKESQIQQALFRLDQLNDGDEAFKSNLSQIQQKLFKELVSFIEENSVMDEQFNVKEAVLNSRFYLSLSAEHKEQFRMFNIFLMNS